MRKINEDHCLDCDKTKRISEREVYEITKRIMKGKPVTALQKNNILSRLRNDVIKPAANMQDH